MNTERGLLNFLQKMTSRFGELLQMEQQHLAGYSARRDPLPRGISIVRYALVYQKAQFGSHPPPRMKEL